MSRYVKNIVIVNINLCNKRRNTVCLVTRNIVLCTRCKIKF